MTAAESNTDVSFYEAGHQRQTCTVLANASALTCSPEGLSAGTRLSFYGMACVAGFECSQRKFAVGYTLPDGMLINFQFFFILFPFIVGILSAT